MEGGGEERKMRRNEEDEEEKEVGRSRTKEKTEGVGGGRREG
jgi:hypothetical protein